MWKAVLIVTCAAGLSGCFTSNVVVTVRPDGTGTVEQTTTIRPAAMAEFHALVSPDLVPSAPDPAAFSRELRGFAAEANLGRNLRFRSARPINTAETTGLTVTYDFDDVTALELEVVPHMPGTPGFYGIAAKDGASTRLDAKLEPIAANMERLTISFPRFAMDPSAEPPAQWASGSAAEMAAFRNIVKGSRIAIVVKSEAPIVRTNSPFREDNQVTLLDVDVAEALFSKQIGMLSVAPATFDELLNALADLPGVKLARDHAITLDFQNPSAAALPPAPAPSSQAPPDTDVFLAALARFDGKLSIGPPINISNNRGYDNQPSFTPDGRNLLFASVRGPSVPLKGEAPPSLKTDIYRYEIAPRRVWRVTNTPDEGEFSPAVMPDGKRISVVRVEADGTQRLWSVVDGAASSAMAVILPDVKPVGYYAWIDEHAVALFVLGQNGQPATLQVADLRTGKAEQVAVDIGRSLQRTPSGAVSFVQRGPVGAEGAPSAMIRQLLNKTITERETISTASLVRPAAGASDPFLAWTPDGTLLMAAGSTIYQWRTGDPDWSVVADLGAFGLRDVSRLTVSPKGDRIAIVALAR